MEPCGGEGALIRAPSGHRMGWIGLITNWLTILRRLRMFALCGGRIVLFVVRACVFVCICAYVYVCVCVCIHYQYPSQEVIIYFLWPPGNMADTALVPTLGKCRNPPEVGHALHDGPRGQLVYPLGTQLNYKCEDGYNIDGFFRSMCVGDGRWVGPRMTCSREWRYLWQTDVRTHARTHTRTYIQTDGETAYVYYVYWRVCGVCVRLSLSLSLSLYLSLSLSLSIYIYIYIYIYI